MIEPIVFLSRWWGSNPRPAVYETAALPTELQRLIIQESSLIPAQIISAPFR